MPKGCGRQRTLIQGSRDADSCPTKVYGRSTAKAAKMTRQHRDGINTIQASHENLLRLSVNGAAVVDRGDGAAAAGVALGSLSAEASAAYACATSGCPSFRRWLAMEKRTKRLLLTTVSSSASGLSMTASRCAASRRASEWNASSLRCRWEYTRARSEDAMKGSCPELIGRHPRPTTAARDKVRPSMEQLMRVAVLRRF
jgi:hypothetical protein